MCATGVEPDRLPLQIESQRVAKESDLQQGKFGMDIGSCILMAGATLGLSMHSLVLDSRIKLWINQVMRSSGGTDNDASLINDGCGESAWSRVVIIMPQESRSHGETAASSKYSEKVRRRLVLREFTTRNPVATEYLGTCTLLRAP